MTQVEVNLQALAHRSDDMTTGPGQVLLSIAEQEQERIGRELHDGVGQELAGAAFLAKALAAKLAVHDPALADDAEWIKQILGRCVESVRSLSRHLSPTELERGNLAAALERLCADVERTFGIACRLSIDIGDESIAPGPTRQLFRVCQEALNNATRHGACRQLGVRLDRRSGRLRMAIVDDGVGFAPKPRCTVGIGLNSMRLRARSLQGTLRFGRRSGRTLVVLRIPVHALAEPA